MAGNNELFLAVRSSDATPTSRVADTPPADPSGATPTSRTDDTPPTDQGCHQVGSALGPDWHTNFRMQGEGEEVRESKSAVIIGAYSIHLVSEIFWF